uniref:Uncharacterized protein n=1 Tax=Anguilla anguilla TaxID=7936 RepID=A0A0E9RHV8_ANGAN
MLVLTLMQATTIKFTSNNTNKNNEENKHKLYIIYT